MYLVHLCERTFCQPIVSTNVNIYVWGRSDSWGKVYPRLVWPYVVIETMHSRVLPPHVLSPLVLVRILAVHIELSLVHSIVRLYIPRRRIERPYVYLRLLNWTAVLYIRSQTISTVYMSVCCTIWTVSFPSVFIVIV